MKNCRIALVNHHECHRKPPSAECLMIEFQWEASPNVWKSFDPPVEIEDPDHGKVMWKKDPPSMSPGLGAHPDHGKSQDKTSLPVYKAASDRMVKAMLNHSIKVFQDSDIPRELAFSNPRYRPWWEATDLEQHVSSHAFRVFQLKIKQHLSYMLKDNELLELTISVLKRAIHMEYFEELARKDPENERLRRENEGHAVFLQWQMDVLNHEAALRLGNGTDLRYAILFEGDQGDDDDETLSISSEASLSSDDMSLVSNWSDI